ncbi:hypothetical protein [Anaerotignum propionicum]|uniref:hypothetical protein n=1 Tax=Anaerotignum propionicum TaxID=28446 RepID=UPI00289D1926|nr:hypothetical protein [Anaerotignum propionicum]
MGYSFDEGDFSTFISKEDAYKNICSLINTSEFDALLYDFKKAAAAFYLWYNLNGKDTRGIADKTVKNLLAEWENKQLQYTYSL